MNCQFCERAGLNPRPAYAQIKFRQHIPDISQDRRVFVWVCERHLNACPNPQIRQFADEYMERETQYLMMGGR